MPLIKSEELISSLLRSYRLTNNTKIDWYAHIIFHRSFVEPSNTLAFLTVFW